MKCWVVERMEDEPELLEYYGPCKGEISMSEDYPGEYTYFCEKHGNMDDYYERKSKRR